MKRARSLARLARLAALLTVGVLLPGLAQAQAQLRAAPTVSGPQITLGDLFDNAGAAAGVVVGRAPQPGQRVVFSAPVLQNRAARAGLSWANAEGVREVVVSGAAAPAPAARTQAARAAAAPTAAPVAGSEREVAVLTRAIARGEAIGIDDVTFVAASAATPADAIAELDQLVGMSARRALAPDRPLRASDVMVTPAVKRGEPVTLMFQSGAMRIAMRARALEDGAPGEVVRVLNTDSNRTVEALVEAPGVARVLIPATSATITAGPVRARTGGSR
jgi:flagellar basal body P-ring formation protein FlgA